MLLSNPLVLKWPQSLPKEWIDGHTSTPIGFAQTMLVELQFYSSPLTFLSFHLNCIYWQLLQWAWVNPHSLKTKKLERKSALLYCLWIESRSHIDNLGGLGILKSPLQVSHLKYSSWKSLRKTYQDETILKIKLRLYWINIIPYLFF